MSNDSSDLFGIVAPSGEYANDWPSQFVLPQGINGDMSDAGWKEGAEGFPQQTFLGASIRNFNINAGFGDTTSTLSVDLVNDEFNLSDQTLMGSGDDPYHNGDSDQFRPPVVGTPVFFKFGGNPASIEQAWRKTFDDLYKIDTINEPVDFPTITTAGEIKRIPASHHYLRGIENKGKHNQINTWVDKSALYNSETQWRGKDHLVFGGILQSYTQNRGPGGNPLYAAQVTDPREILSNAVVLLSNYAGTTFNNKNLLNVFGFLEHDPSEPTKKAIEGLALSKNVVTKVINPLNGNFIYVGDDNYHFEKPAFKGTFFTGTGHVHFPDTIGETFPITGQGFARRSERGMPWYRIRDGLNALMGVNGFLPTEYVEAGYGGAIDFRGYKYIVDFSGIPSELIPDSYFFDFEQTDLLSLSQEICDIISHELFVTLLPVIDHPSCKVIHDYNSNIIKLFPQFRSQMIAGIIRVDAIDKRKPPTYGAIKSYLDFLLARGVEVENQDLGYELSNVTTDKFVVGGQETNMYYFSAAKDRNDMEVRKHKDGQTNKLELLEREKWSLDTMLKQQVLPFYGFLGPEKAVTIPKGFGSYQQILLDATNLNAFGVGNYYVATELELRAALVSYQQWKNFLLQYDEQWMRKLEGPIKHFDQHVPADVAAEIADAGMSDDVTEMFKACFDGKYGVSVPRCVWRSDKNYLGKDGYPASPCAPPFGYPLYYKRAEKIGVAEGGIVSVLNAQTTLTSNLRQLKDKLDTNEPYFNTIKEDALEQIKKIEKSINVKWIQFKRAFSNDLAAQAAFSTINIKLYTALAEAKAYVKQIEKDLKQADADDKLVLAHINDTISNNKKLLKNASRIAKKGEKNAQKVYNFVKKVAEENLGKKFLVKIPKKANMNFEPDIKYWEKGIVEDFSGGDEEGEGEQQENMAVSNVKKGPFGFRPLPVTAGAAYHISGEAWDIIIKNLGKGVKVSDAFEHYLDPDHKTANASFPNGYTNGALKCNYNPFTETWEYNYKPEPQGGFVDFSLVGMKTVGMGIGFEARYKRAFPKFVTNALAPLDSKNIMMSSNRMSCYVRFDNSHLYDFSKISSESFSQQSINEFGWIIPDALEELDNVDPDKSMTMAEVQARQDEDKLLDRQPPSVAFVKCDVDEEFYMAPRVMNIPTKVFARSFKVVVPTPRMEIIKVAPEDNPDTDNVDESKCLVPSGVTRKVIPVFSPAEPKKKSKEKTVMTTDFLKVKSTDGVPLYFDQSAWDPDSTFGGDIIGIDKETIHLVDGRKVAQDPDSVYALVTLPGMVTPTLDLRYCDGPQSCYQTAKMYNLQTRDVVKGVIGFEEPAEFTNGVIKATCETLQDFELGEINDARAAQKKALKNANVASMDSSLAYNAPSPVYPDMVAIPLMSMERCYGPWLSNASLDPGTLSPGVTNIGGKIEFVKDENLAPWNYGGYQLMNEAGFLQAQFSNSLLLFTERGGFVIPQAPTGVAIARALQNGGPLVTSINVDISQSKISTTVKMDLYTSSFGKLQKQKEGNIAQIGRERQKLVDQRNNAIRRGMGKTLSNKNFYEAVLKGGGADLLKAASASTQHFSDFEKGQVEENNIFLAAKTSWNNGEPVNFNGTVAGGAGDMIKKGNSYIQTNLNNVGEMMGLSQDTVGALKTAGLTNMGFIGDFINLVDMTTHNENEPRVARPPQKGVDQRRGPAPPDEEN